LSTSGARKLLVAFGLRLGTITAGNGCATGRLGYYPLGWEAFFVILVTAVDGVMPLQKVSSSEAHMAGKALEWLNVGVCSSQVVSDGPVRFRYR
jgi:hypothetical protein